MPQISDYDQYNYNYKTYWENRDYENKAEKIVLEKYFRGEIGRYFIDIGGSFGRNLDLYYENYKVPIVLDYSIKTLQSNKDAILKKYPNTQLIAANAYKMPFKDTTIDGTMMIRVLHHLEDQESIFEEINRITRYNGIFILEYANKMHIKAIFKWIISLKFKNFSTEPYQQPNQNNFEGTENGKTAVFLNYHPSHIENLLNKHKFDVLHKTNCSFLRMNLFKKYFSLPTLAVLEKLLQKTISWTNIAPSIILKNMKKSTKENFIFANLKDILCCPNCKKTLKIQENVAICNNCKKTFKKEQGIWDFRI